MRSVSRFAPEGQFRVFKNQKMALDKGEVEDFSDLSAAIQFAKKSPDKWSKVTIYNDRGEEVKF